MTVRYGTVLSCSENFFELFEPGFPVAGSESRNLGLERDPIFWLSDPRIRFRIRIGKLWIRNTVELLGRADQDPDPQLKRSKFIIITLGCVSYHGSYMFSL